MIELIMVVLIVAILATAAAPSLISSIAHNRISSETNDLVADISYARNEAASRGQSVTICMSANQTTCNGTAWANGRIIFADTNKNGALDAGESLLKVTPSLSGNTTLVSSGFPNAGYIQFRPYGGLSPATPGSFKLCSTNDLQGRQVAVALFGTPTTTIVSCP